MHLVSFGSMRNISSVKQIKVSKNVKSKSRKKNDRRPAPINKGKEILSLRVGVCDYVQVHQITSQSRRHSTVRVEKMVILNTRASRLLVVAGISFSKTCSLF